LRKEATKDAAIRGANLACAKKLTSFVIGGNIPTMKKH